MKISMRKFCIIIGLLFLVPVVAQAKGIDPIVSTDWLAKNLSNPKMVIIDIRKTEDYKENHIQKSVNVLSRSWLMKKKDMLNEVIADDDLKELIGDAGIGNDSIVVVVGSTATPPEQISTARVAWTLVYAGVKNVAILNGGISKWEKEGKPLTKQPFKPKAKQFKPKFDRGILATKDYVMKNLDSAVIVDTRTPDFYGGEKKQTFVERPGHIKNAKNLPWNTLFNEDKTYKNKEELAKVMTPVLGTDKTKPVVFYCDTGMFASPGWFVAYEVLGYGNAKVYDGAAQEWAADPNVPMEK